MAKVFFMVKVLTLKPTPHLANISYMLLYRNVNFVFNLVNMFEFSTSITHTCASRYPILYFEWCAHSWVEEANLTTSTHCKINLVYLLSLFVLKARQDPHSFATKLQNCIICDTYDDVIKCDYLPFRHRKWSEIPSDRHESGKSLR